MIVKDNAIKLSKSTKYDRSGDSALRIVAKRSSTNGVGLYLLELFIPIMNGTIRGVWRYTWAPMKPM